MPVATEQHQRLLNRILASRDFEHAYSLKRILQYLCDVSARPGGGKPKEYDIAVGAMGRPASFDSRIDPVVRVSMGAIRARLDSFYASEGRSEEIRLIIPKGQYKVAFVPVQSQVANAQPGTKSASLERFWEPYFRGSAANVIVHTEPLFFRDQADTYVRNWYVNEPARGLDSLKEHAACALSGDLEPSYHYLSAGEVHCLLSLTRMFHELHIPVETRNARTANWSELGDANLILLGATRTNNFMNSLAGAECFSMLPKSIENRAHRAGEEQHYYGRRWMDGQLPRMSEYTILTRRPGLKKGRAVTVLGSNHGRAVGGVGQILTLEDRVRTIVETIDPAGDGAGPEHFQVLFRVDKINIDDEVIHVEPVANRVYS